MKYRILLNRTEDAQGRPVGFLGYQNGHIMADVYHGDLADYRSESRLDEYTDLLDQIFQKFNVSHPYDYLNRSLSVGDVVVFETVKGERAFACKNFGWETVPVPLKPKNFWAQGARK